MIENNGSALGLFERDHQEIAQVHLADLVREKTSRNPFFLMLRYSRQLVSVVVSSNFPVYSP